jgi:hypothetical protein
MRGTLLGVIDLRTCVRLYSRTREGTNRFLPSLNEPSGRRDGLHYGVARPAYLLVERVYQGLGEPLVDLDRAWDALGSMNPDCDDQEGVI